MKRVYIFAFIALFLLCAASCGSNRQQPETTGQTTVSTLDTSSSSVSEQPISSEASTAPEATTAAPETTTAAMEETLPPASGGTSPCYVHCVLYHGFPWEWMEYVGVEAFEQWISDTDTGERPDSGGCPYPDQNVYTFIHDFNYPKDVFIEQYNTCIWVEYGYNVDLLYGDDPQAAESYYRTGYKEDEPDWEKADDLWDLKWELRQKYPEKLKNLDNWKTDSLLVMMQAAGISAADMQDGIAQTRSAGAKQAAASCDFGAVEALTVNEQKELMTEHSAFYQDCLLLGWTPYETPYEKQVAENAARSGGSAES